MAIPAQALILALFAWVLWQTTGTTRHAAPAALAAVWAYAAIHAGLGLVLAGWASRVPPDQRHLSRLWQRYAALLTLAAAGFPTALRLLAEVA